VRLPPDFKVTHAARCTLQFLGCVYDLVVVLSEVTQSGAGTVIRTIWFAIDADGQPMRVFYLDYLGIFLFAAYLLTTEWRFGKTLGMDLLDMRVQSLGGGPLTFVQAGKRLSVRLIPTLIFAPLLFLTEAETDTALILLTVAALAALIQLINFIIAVRRGNLPWHDRWAGTEVVRGR
jgi:uncharacterized RDD family membrane protein YckC